MEYKHTEQSSAQVKEAEATPELATASNATLARAMRLLQSPLSGVQRRKLVQNLGQHYGNRQIQRLVSLLNSSSTTLQRAVLSHSSHPTLAWADFQGAAQASSPLDASTSTGLSANFGASGVLSTENITDDNGQAAVHATFGVPSSRITTNATMNSGRSWVKSGSKTAALLNHEQGHYDISNVFAAKTKTAMEDWVTNNAGDATRPTQRAARNAAQQDWNSHNPRQGLTNIITSGLATWRQVDLDQPTDGEYDVQTSHGTDPDIQAQWDAGIASNLPVYTVP